MPLTSSRLERPGNQGFSLIELLLVLVILSVVSAIAIPHFMGQRRRARVIGDAMAGANVLRMALETRRAETGLYGTPGQTYVWRADGSDASGPAFISSFDPRNASKMDYTVVVDASGVAYILRVTDPNMSNITAFETNQLGTVLARLD